MRKRLRLLLVGIALLLLGGWLTLWLTAPKHRITKANIERIQQGMTQEEVETLLGVPPGDYSGGLDYVLMDSHAFLWPELRPVEWVGNDAGVTVYFDPDGRVRYVERLFVFREETWFVRILSWLGL